MMMHGTTPVNQQKVAQLQEAVWQLLAQVLKEGFFGSAGVELSIQDGTIQTIRRKTEQIER
jgi:hypothetical protein